MTKEEQKAYNKEYYKKNKQKIDEKNRINAELNKEKIKQYQKAYREKNKAKQKEYCQNYYIENKDSIREANKKWVSENKERAIELSKEHYKANKERYKKLHKQWKTNNPNKTKELRREYERKRTEIDPLYKLTNRVRKTISKALINKKIKKNSRSQVILGCTFEEFKRHIESNFEPWMNWDNYGNPKDGVYEINKTWDIDHIIPLSSAKTEDDIIRLNHYSNLQPLCSYQNRWVKKDC